MSRAQFEALKRASEVLTALAAPKAYFFLEAFFFAFFFAFAMLASPVNRVSPMSEYIDAKLNYKRARVWYGVATDSQALEV